MSGLAQKAEKRYTYQDYLGFPDEIRCEIIGGIIYDMTPAPTTRHQHIVGNLFSIIKNKLTGKPCIPFISPVDVVLSDYDVVQPDIIVLCNKSKISRKNIKGAPDLIMEVISPTTALKDKKAKKALYERHGVKEYLVVDPLGNYSERFVLQGEKFGGPEIYGPEESITLESLEGLEIELSKVFGE